MIYNAQRRDISIAVAGDAMITRRMRAFNEDNFLKLTQILKQADVSVANLEMLFHDYESSWQWSGATYTRSDPKNLDELKWMGIDAVTTANNHSFDFSEGGFLTTLDHWPGDRPSHCRGRTRHRPSAVAGLRGLSTGPGCGYVGHQHFQRAIARRPRPPGFPGPPRRECAAPPGDTPRGAGTFLRRCKKPTGSWAMTT